MAVIEIDDELKAQADGLYKFLGMTTEMAVTIFLNRSILDDGFPLSLHYEPDEETKAAMAETEDIIAHPERYKSYTDEQELFAELDAKMEAGLC